MIKDDTPLAFLDIRSGATLAAFVTVSGGSEDNSERIPRSSHRFISVRRGPAWSGPVRGRGAGTVRGRPPRPQGRLRRRCAVRERILDPGAPAAPTPRHCGQAGGLPPAAPAPRPRCRDPEQHRRGPIRAVGHRGSPAWIHPFGRTPVASARCPAGPAGVPGRVLAAVMTLHKLTAGDGYLYLMRHVAKADADKARTDDVRADATSYYTAEGNPPGVWLGAGAGVLGLAGSTVTEAQMRNLFGTGAHPDADRIQAEFLAEHVRAGMTGRQLRELAAAAQRHAQLGRRFAEYRPLPPMRERVADRVAALQAETGRAATVAEVARIRAAESRRAAGAVAGFDLVFTPVKSLALMWALDPRAEVREAIRMAHEQAMTETLAFLEAHAAHTRTGADGLAQIDATGLVAVAFTHYDSRAGDPNLHTHVAVSNKVQGVDGVWRALDARGLHALAVTASEHYNTRIQAHVTDRLTIGFEAREVTRGKQPVVEVAGIPQGVLDHFSRRRAQLEARYDQLLGDYRTRHGRDPDFPTARALAERANLETRRAKGLVRSLADMRAAWREDLNTTFGPHALHQVMAAVTVRNPHHGPADTVDVRLVPGTDEHARLVDTLARHVAGQVTNSRSTWTIWNLRSEAERALRHPAILTVHGLGPAAAAQLAGLAEAVADRAAAPGVSIRLDPPALADEPASLRRGDGASVFTRHGADRYTSQAVLDAEQRLLTAATVVPDASVPGPSRRDVERILTASRADDGHRLDAGQRELVTVFAADPRTLVVGLGPAGTGKTTAMRALRDVLDHAGGAGAGTTTGRLVPLATSAHAAAVLAADLGVPAENVHKFLHDHATGSPSRIPLSAGDVVLVDEAGMAGTPNLDRLLTLVQAAGARLRLLGDDRQLAAVESGGALRLLAEEAGAVELDVVHRFADPAEAAATLALRTGDHRALAFYQAQGRIHGGSLQEVTDRAYAAWPADVHAGKTSVLATTTTTDVTRLAARARADRVAAGQVEAGGVTLHDGNTAGVGDWIVTRHNDRRLTSTDRRVWVRNGDPWRVVHRRDDGALTVQHLRDGARLVLPPGYVTAHVELLYATTAHRVQGATVDTAHALITPEAAREHLYVLATRARHATHLYVQTHQMLPADEDERVDRRSWDPAGLDAAVVLQRILDREAAEPSATQALRDAQTAATSLATLVPRYEHAVAHLTAGHYLNVLRAQLTATDFAEVDRDESAANLITELRRAHQAGWQPERALAHAVHHARAAAATWDAGGAGSGRSMTRLVAEELRGLAASVNPPPHLHQPTRADLDRYVELVAGRYRHQPIGLDRVRVESALDTPRLLRTGAFDDPTPGRALGEIAASTYRQDVARALPAGLARRILQDRDNSAGWRTLQIVLRRAETAGHDIPSLLAAPAVRAGVPEHGPAAVHLAEQVTRVLAEHPTPALAGMEGRGRAGIAYAWNHLAWAMKAAEDCGTDPATLLPDADETVAGGQVPAVVATWLHVQNQAGTATRPAMPQPVLPWAPAPIPGTVTEPGETAYLDELRHLIGRRLTALRGELQTAVLTGQPPAWAESLTTACARYEHSRPRWLEHATVVAAYREQHLVPGQDPRQGAGQPLGPHPEPAPHGDRTHARAHACAAHALTRAWEIAHPTGTRHQDAGAVPAAESEARRQIATAAWTALTPEQKTAVAATVLARLGTLPTPAHPAGTVPVQAGAATEGTAVMSVVSGLDEAVTYPTRAADLHRALIDHGHLPEPDTAPPNTSSRSPRERPARLHRSSNEPRPAGRRAQQRPRRPDVEPEQQTVEQHRRYDPQPGRIEPQPGRQYRL